MFQWIEKNIFQGKRPYLLILGLGFLIYFQAFFFDFSYLDDNTLILDNQYFLGNLSNIVAAFRTDVFHLFNHSAFYYRPILTLSFMIDYQLGGIEPFMYHFTNVALHLFAACLVFLFLKKLNYRKDLSLLFSLIFLAHPILTQTVAWIHGRNDSLLAVFILLTFISLVEYLNKNFQIHFIYFLIFFALAIFTKESAIVFLPLAAFYLYFINKEKKNIFKSVYIFAGMTLILAVWAILRHNALSGSMSMNFSTMIKSVLLNSPATIQFIGKVFFPFNLSVLPVMQDTTFVYGIVAVILVLIAFFFTKEKRWSFMLFGLGWFFAFLLPSFVRPNTQLVADFIEHRMYVPIIGFFIFLMETDAVKKFNYKKNSSLFIACAILIILSSITIAHSRVFVDRITFWKNAVENSPHYPLAHRNLGAMYYLDKQPDKAAPEFEKAIELNSTEEMAHNNLGLIYMDRGDFEKSENEFKKELEVNPYYDNAYSNLGLLYFKMGKFDQAEDSWKKALGINPNLFEVIQNLATLNYQQKNFQEAATWVNELNSRGIQAPVELQKLVQPTNSMRMK